MTDRIKEHILPALVAAMMAWLTLSFIIPWQFPPDPDDWLMVEEVFIPNFKLGEDPIVTYRRQVNHPFISQFTVEVFEVDRETGDRAPIQLCEGSDRFRYSVGPLANASLKLSKYIGTITWPASGKCKWEADKFYISDTTWPMISDSGERRVQTKTSNIFSVSK